MPPIVQLLVNKTAGAWSHQRVDALAAAFRAAGAQVIMSDCRSTIAPGVDHVCVVGGDGTLRHAVAAVRKSARTPILSVYPAGTVNLIARECGYRRNPAAFVAQVLSAPDPRLHYVGAAGEIMLCSVASVGPDSFVVAALSSRLKQRVGRAAYVLAFVRILGSWPRSPLRLRANGKGTQCEAVFIAKGRHYAGPWRVSHDASADQPLLHVVALRRATRIAFLRFLWLLWRGKTSTEDPNIIRFSCAELHIEGQGALPVQADGDIVAYLPVDIAIDPSPLPFA